MQKNLSNRTGTGFISLLPVGHHKGDRGVTMGNRGSLETKNQVEYLVISLRIQQLKGNVIFPLGITPNLTPTDGTDALWQPITRQAHYCHLQTFGGVPKGHSRNANWKQSVSLTFPAASPPHWVFLTGRENVSVETTGDGCL